MWICHLGKRVNEGGYCEVQLNSIQFDLWLGLTASVLAGRTVKFSQLKLGPGQKAQKTET